ncbi:MAG: hypothetical protein E7656_00790 [Ruminococcaceae bacterium]|nr:hypothetical protein [Oscillospiraceae bacterium]
MMRNLEVSMENKNTIDISVFFKRWKLIVSFILVAFIIGFCRATFFSSPVYEVSRAYSIKNSATYSNDDSSKVTSINDMTVATNLTNIYKSYIDLPHIIEGLADFMNETRDDTDKISTRLLSSSISVQQVDKDVPIMLILVTTRDMKLSEEISSAVDTYLPPRVSDGLGYAELKAQGVPQKYVRKASPISSGIRFGIIGAILGLLAVAVSVFFSNKIAEEDDISKKYGLPVLGNIPNPTIKQKGGNRYGK